jgi:hypothetical protein
VSAHRSPTPETRPGRSDAGFSWTAAPLHAVLLAAFPVLFLFAENAADQLVLDPLWWPLGLAIGGAIVVVAISIGLTRDPVRGGLVASLLIALFFSFGHVWFLVADVLSSRWILVAVYALVAAIGILLIWRGGRWTVPASQFANAAAVVLVVINVIRIVDFTSGVPAAAGGDPSPGPSVAANDDRDRPDVYFIVFDRYANSETLDRFYGFDNRPFLRELERRGFAVADDSWSNYFKTAPSLLGTMSMEYLDGEVFREEDEDPPTMAPIHRRLQRSLPVTATFKELGYEYIHIGSWWNATSRNADADLSLTYERNSQFGAALMDTTALALLRPPEQTEEEPETLDRPELVRRHTLFEFDRIEDAMRRRGPTFVFAHVLVPHPPYVFRRDGSMTTPEERQDTPRPKLYTDQLTWTNSRILELVDQALDVPAGEEPVIILQADEGPYPPRFARDSETFDWLEQAEPDEILQKYGILNAMHLPGIDAADAGIHERISPVNTFRIVFSEYFGADLPLLPDTVWLTPDYARMYDFTEYERP